MRRKGSGCGLSVKRSEIFECLVKSIDDRCHLVMQLMPVPVYQVGAKQKLFLRHHKEKQLPSCADFAMTLGGATQLIWYVQGVMAPMDALQSRPNPPKNKLHHKSTQQSNCPIQRIVPVLKFDAGPFLGLAVVVPVASAAAIGISGEAMAGVPLLVITAGDLAISQPARAVLCTPHSCNPTTGVRCSKYQHMGVKFSLTVPHMVCPLPCPS